MSDSVQSSIDSITKVIPTRSRVGWLTAVRDRLFQPVDAASLVAFRMSFGAIMLWEVWRYWSHGWIERYYSRPDFYFKYYGFEWVQPWGGDGMYWHFAIVGILAALIAIGFVYRVATVVFILAFSYIFLLDQAHYLNHFYLVILVGLLMCVLPANRSFAVDAWLRPRLRSASVPTWAVWSLRAQFEILYLYAGIVKINADWLRLEPLGMWLVRRSDFPLIGHLFTETWVVAIAAYGVILLHVVGAPLLLWRRTRLVVFIIYVAFHLMNHFIFSIGIFPWFTIFGTLIFFEPDWPRRVMSNALAWFGRTSARVVVTARSTWFEGPKGMVRPPHSVRRAQQWLVLALLSLWLAYQIVMPLRHLLYPGNVSWTEEGHRFAWRMKLRDKRGQSTFEVRDPTTGRTWKVRPTSYLTHRQARKMTCRPDMVLQLAHHLAAIWTEDKNIANVEVRATVKCSLNGRRRALLIDPARDLTKIERNLRHADWILPLNEPFRRK